MKGGGAGTALALLVLLQGCGYALVGRGITTDPSIKRIGVVFRDATGKPGLDQKVTEKVIEELLKRGRFDVVQETEGVDAVVQGDIVRYLATPVGFSQQGAGAQATTQASRYAIILTARVRYAKVGATEPIWQNDSISVRDESDVGDSSDTFFDREDQVIDRLAASFARTVVSSMLEAF
jgi:hypothetical protein